MTIQLEKRSRAAHHKTCTCASCRHKRSKGCGCANGHAKAKVSASELAFETSTTPRVASCDPARHAFRKLNVVRWKNRYRPCRRNIPAGLSLAILSRARTRVPLRSVQWLIRQAKGRHADMTHWVHRLPKSHLDSLVDLTVELHIQQKAGMTLNAIQETFEAYLEQRHARELGAACNRGFFLYNIQTGNSAGKLAVERQFDLIRFGLDLDWLFQRGGVAPSRTVGCSRGPDEVPQRFFLLSYITLPNAIEAVLREPLPKPKPRPKPSVKQAIRQVLKDLRRLPEGHQRDRAICLVKKLRNPANDDKYVTEHQAHGYASKPAAGAPHPSDYTESARKDFRDAIRLTSTRKSFLRRVLGIDEDIFAGLQRVNREYQMTGSAPRGATARRMRDWVASQQGNPSSIYSCYTD